MSKIQDFLEYYEQSSDQIDLKQIIGKDKSKKLQDYIRRSQI